MIACYDLSRNPPTYDVVAFLAHVELERLRIGAEHVDVHILLGPDGGFRRDNLWPRSREERCQLLHNVVLPLCRLLPSVQSTQVSPRSAASEPHCFGYGARLIGLPAILDALRRGCRPLRAPRTQWGDGRPRITMTLREAAHHPLRNSRTSEWVLAAEELAERGCLVTILRDAARADVPLVGGRCPAVCQVPKASVDLAQRAALYASADLNVGICNGPMWMAVFMDAPVLMLRPTTNAAGGCYDDAFYRRWGVPRGSQLPTSPPYQRLVWEEDRCDAIVRSIELAVEEKERFACAG